VKVVDRTSKHEGEGKVKEMRKDPDTKNTIVKIKLDSGKKFIKRIGRYYKDRNPPQVLVVADKTGRRFDSDSSTDSDSSVLLDPDSDSDSSTDSDERNSTDLTDSDEEIKVDVGCVVEERPTWLQKEGKSRMRCSA
jgi:hypothetical protein